MDGAITIWRHTRLPLFCLYKVIAQSVAQGNLRACLNIFRKSVVLFPV
jgi:hypothetical protein